MLVFTDIPHTKLPGPRQRTKLDESHGSFSHECRQPPNQAHGIIRRCRQLAFDGLRGVPFTTFALPSTSSGHEPRPLLPLFTSDDLEEIHYPGAGWSPAIRSCTCWDTSRSTATSSS